MVCTKFRFILPNTHRLVFFKSLMLKPFPKKCPQFNRTLSPKARAIKQLLFQNKLHVAYPVDSQRILVFISYAPAADLRINSLGTTTSGLHWSACSVLVNIASGCCVVSGGRNMGIECDVTCAIDVKCGVTCDIDIDCDVTCAILLLSEVGAGGGAGYGL